MKLFLCLLAVVLVGLIACTDSPVTGPADRGVRTDTLTVVQKDTVWVTRTVVVHDTVTVTRTVYVPSPIRDVAEVDTLYATRMGLTPFTQSLPGGWISQRWEDDWAVSISWWYNPAFVGRRLVVHTQDGNVQLIGSGRDLHILAGDRSRIDGWWDTGFTTRGDK